MAGIRGYWDQRLERYAYWASGARSVNVATFAKLRVDGTRLNNGEVYEPDSERETELLLASLMQPPPVGSPYHCKLLIGGLERRVKWIDAKGVERQRVIMVPPLYPRRRGDIAELARLLDCSVSAVQSNVNRAFRYLQLFQSKRRQGEQATLERPQHRPRAQRSTFASAVAEA